VTAKQSAVKRYVVKLSDEERERLDALTNMGKHPARLLTKARILLKADASEAGEGWSDSRIAEALDTSTDTVARTRQQLVEEGFEAVLVAAARRPGDGNAPREDRNAPLDLSRRRSCSRSTLGAPLRRNMTSYNRLCGYREQRLGQTAYARRSATVSCLFSRRL
jgi:Homeodomain-like domain